MKRFAIALLPVLSCIIAPYSYYDDYERCCCQAGFCHYQYCPSCCRSYFEDTFDPPPDTTGDHLKYKSLQSREARKK